MNNSINVENEEIEIEKLKKELKENISKKWFHLNKLEVDLSILIVAVKRYQTKLK